MKKTEWYILAAAAAASAALRALQMRTGFDAENLPVSGNAFALLLPVLLAAAAVFFAVRARRLPGLNREGEGRGLAESFAFAKNSPLLGCAVSGTFLIVASAAAAFAGYTQGLHLTLLSAASAVAALCYLYAVFSISRGNAASGYALLLPVLVLLAYLILLYRADASDPVLGHIYVEILAVSALTLSSLELAAFAFGCGSPRVFVPSCAMAVICSAALAAECGSLSGTFLFLGAALLTTGFLGALRRESSEESASA
ncbi:MAG: hypothetical protein IJU66_09325 [Oscillospiraceae bacterium]|nr:hypothetical protein [Oscillospiraceae bacterium]